MKKSAASSSATSGVTLSLLNYVVARITSMGDAIELFPCELTSQYWRKKKKGKRENEQQKRSFVRGEIARDQIMRDRRTRQGYPKILIAPRARFVT